MTYAELLALRATKYKRMQEIFALARTEKRNINDDEKTEYDALKAEFDKLSEDMQRVKDLEDAERQMQEPQRKPLTGGGARGGFTPPGQNPNQTEEEKRAYSDSFVSLLRGRATADDWDRLNQRALNTGVDTEGGYLVPETWTANIFEGLKEESNIRDDITIIQTTSTTNIPLDGDDIEFEDLEELEDYPVLQPNFGNKKLGAFKKGGIVLVSRELLNDSAYAVQQMVESKMRRGIARGDDRGFIRGTGVNKTTGLLTATTQEVETIDAGITYQDLVNMKYKVPAEYRNGAKWRVSDAFLKAVEGLVDANGKPIFNQGDITKGTPSSLLGYPIAEDNLLDNDITSGKYPALFGNFKFYVGADRGEIYIQVLREAYASKGAIGILVDKRTDGNLADTKAMAKLKIK